MINLQSSRGWGAMMLVLGVHKRPKLEKWVYFWQWSQILEKRWRKIERKKNMFLVSLFMLGKYLFRVCFESPFMRMMVGWLVPVMTDSL